MVISNISEEIWGLGLIFTHGCEADTTATCEHMQFRKTMYCPKYQL